MHALFRFRSAPRAGLIVVSLLAAVAWSDAQEPRERQREGGQPDDRQFQAPRDAEGRDREGTPEGMPQARLAPQGPERPELFPRRWVLGVNAYNTATGVVVTRVAPGSPAAQAGLEPTDRIVTVSGFQVGNVNGQFFLLGDELQLRAGRNGRVQLLVQNCRDNQLVNLDISLRRDADFERPVPRERE